MKILFVSPSGFDYISSQLIEGFHLLSKKVNDVEFKATAASTHHGAEVEDLVPVTDNDEVLKLAKEWADFIILSSAGNVLNLGDVEKIIYEDVSLVDKKIFLDGHDGNGYLIDPRHFRRYFKREYRLPENTIRSYFNTRSINFGIYNYHTHTWEENSDPQSDWKYRDIDVSYVCFTGSNEMRVKCQEILTELKAKSNLNIFIAGSDKEQPISKKEYDEILSRSKVAISLVGAGMDCLRYWEIPARGAILCSFDLTGKLLIRHNFEHWRSAVFFNTWGNMVDFINFIVLNNNVWCSIRAQADVTRKLHTTMMRAREVIMMSYGV